MTGVERVWPRICGVAAVLAVALPAAAAAAGTAVTADLIAAATAGGRIVFYTSIDLEYFGI